LGIGKPKLRGLEDFGLQAGLGLNRKREAQNRPYFENYIVDASIL